MEFKKIFSIKLLNNKHYLVINCSYFKKKGDYNTFIKVITKLLYAILENQEKIYVIVNLNDVKLNQFDPIFCKQISNILMEKFPEKLEYLEFTNTGKLFKLIFSTLKMFLPKETLEKIKST